MIFFVNFGIRTTLEVCPFGEFVNLLIFIFLFSDLLTAQNRRSSTCRTRSGWGRSARCCQRKRSAQTASGAAHCASCLTGQEGGADIVAGGANMQNRTPSSMRSAISWFWEWRRWPRWRRRCGQMRAIGARCEGRYRYSRAGTISFRSASDRRGRRGLSIC